MRKAIAFCCGSLSIGLASLLAMRYSTWRQLEQASTYIAVAQRASADRRWRDAASAYSEAAGAWPKEMRRFAQFYSLQLTWEHARVRSGEIDSAFQNLLALQKEIESDPALGPNLVPEVRRELAMTAYYEAWLARRQGMPATVWEPLARSARQDFNYLAQSASTLPQAFVDGMRDNARKIGWFERLDNEAIYALPLPEAGLDSNTSVTISGDAKPAGPSAKRHDSSDGRNRIKQSDGKLHTGSSRGRRFLGS